MSGYWDPKTSKAAQEILSNPDDPRHGKASTYRNYRCPCEKCKAANAAAQAAQRAARRNAPIPRRVHGTPNGYTEYGCRKKCCRAAWAEACRNRYHDNKETA